VFPEIANNETRRKAFVNYVVPFLEKHGFQGLDFAWIFPTTQEKTKDKDGFTALLKDLKSALGPKGLLLTAPVSATKSIIDEAYDVPEIIKYVDFLNMFSYKYHTIYERHTGIDAPLYAATDAPIEEQYQTVNFSTKYWLSKGVPSSKLILGLAGFGNSYTLTNPKNHGINASVTLDGPFTDALPFNLICEPLKQPNWTIVFDQTSQTKYAYRNSQWISYEDPDSFGVKAKYAKDLGLGGVILWTVDMDDFNKTCAKETFPLLRSINKIIFGN